MSLENGHDSAEDQVLLWLHDTQPSLTLDIFLCGVEKIEKKPLRHMFDGGNQAVSPKHDKTEFKAIFILSKIEIQTFILG